MAGNKSLAAANKAKKDEFYTQLSDIAAELKHYRHHFQGKTVLCNCDDPWESQFFRFFAMKFNAWGLKRLICTSYGGSKVAGMEQSFLSELMGGGRHCGDEPALLPLPRICGAARGARQEVPHHRQPKRDSL